MLRTPLACERIQWTDPATGIKVVQLTSYPTPSVALPYEWPSITPDGRRVVFMSQREARRGAPWDLFRCDTDGLNLFQLTERDQTAHVPIFDKENAPVAILSLDGKTLFVVWNGDVNVYAVDVETGAQRSIASMESVCGTETLYQHMRLNGAGDMLYIALRKPVVGTIRVDLRSGDAAYLDLAGLLWACLPTERRLVVWRNEAVPRDESADYVSLVRARGVRGFWTTDEDGGDERFFSSDSFAHGSVLGNTASLQGCGIPPERCIWIVKEEKPADKLVQGPYFWHSGPSWDGEWIIADTNWPDDGLQLIHVPSRRFRTVCHPGASREHTRAGHPHPALSHDGRIAVFTSDRMGLPQVYAAHVTDEFRQSIIAGELDRRRDKWI